MPNWCTNSLVVSGPAEEVQRFSGTVKTDVSFLDYSTIVPVGKHIRIIDKRTGFVVANKKNAFEASVDGQRSAWGTKWNNDGDVSFHCSLGYARYDFDSAWGPPESFVAAASKRFPMLTFQLKYYELGMGFYGVLDLPTNENTFSDEIPPVEITDENDGNDALMEWADTFMNTPS